ncbi:MAG: GNAT family N-acetyltransferase [Clostridiales bacterium]|nr:GNAT family N-acetyltransferase [Clostridiales bacterium]
MQVRQILQSKKEFLALLLLADEQEDMIDRYLQRGDMYVLEEAGSALAVIVVTDEGGGTLEIKNLAVRPDAQKRGYGRMMIDYVAGRYRDSFHTLLVGTGDSPLTVPFYERCGFARSHVVKDFFTNYYDHPIIECGMLLRDMVYLKRAILSTSSTGGQET